MRPDEPADDRHAVTRARHLRRYAYRARTVTKPVGRRIPWRGGEPDLKYTPKNRI